MMQKRICLVSPGHIASNPRLVKEANALYQAGYQVRVVAGDYMAAVRPLDQTLLSKVSWSCDRVGLGNRTQYLRRRMTQEIARSLAANIGISHLSLATWAHHPMSYQLARVAAAEPADLYIAHCLAALPAAAIAAQKHQAYLGFDAEDFHVGELAETPQNQTEIAVRDYIERALLPHCDHLTAASPMIAEAYVKRYGVKMKSILNVFSLDEASSSPEQVKSDRVGTEPSLYWFSQTIGPGRGLEVVIQAMGQMQTPVRLHLRGLLAAEYQNELEQLAKAVGVGDRIHLLSSAPPSEMVRLAAEHDIGLSMELTEPYNRSICLTNKIFAYLLAGLPVLMSNTPAQIELAEKLGEAAVIVDSTDPLGIAVTLDQWLINSHHLNVARATAWTLGQKIYNWDVEQYHFLAAVEQVWQ
ncbi:glycosyltransferase [Leptolyngbya sp. NK1-12]|uniref:Glycosyltransferase n=1 Tax=Leptolyngbya sp. NK1-12 TaxID=2547451 RepID=A0AA96WJY7_9CYAN|nr:glycosyltransferase [Leptolyngbya sp. NK1-12]